MTSYFKDGGRDVISRSKVLPPGARQFLIYNKLLLIF